MSIKSTNIDFDTLPNPPLGYSYIGTDLDGVLAIKLDTGSVIRPGGVSYLNQLTDVNISGSTIGQALLWDGEDWVNGDVASTFDDTNLWSSLSGETIERVSGDTLLWEAIDDIVEYDDSNLWSSISGETSERISADQSLETLINDIPEFDDTNLWSSISGETSERISDVSSLETLIGDIPEFDDTNLWSSISGETSERISADQSLATAIGSGGGGDSSYSGLSYNVVTGTTITTTGTTTINFQTTDLYVVDISGNTTTGITFDFSGSTIGKTMVMKITNSGDGNTTGCVFGSSCLVFGTYVYQRVNAVSVICISSTETIKYWVMIAQA